MKKGTFTLSSTNEVTGASRAKVEDWHDAALQLAASGRFEEAESLLISAAESPHFRPGWYGDLGVVYEATGRLDKAIQAFSKFAELEPQSGRAQRSLGEIQSRADSFEAAIKSYRIALTIDPTDRRAAVGLGKLLATLLKFDEAVDVLEHSLAACGDYTEAHLVEASIYLQCREYSAALDHLREVEKVEPNNPDALAAQVEACWGLGRIEDVLGFVRQLIKLGLATEALHSFYNYALLFSANSGAREIKEEARRFGERFLDQSTKRSRTSKVSTEKAERLRIGYLTGEFIKSPAFFFLQPFIGNHDHDKFEVFAYHTRNGFDDATEWYKNETAFRDCRGMSDDAIEQKVLEDGVDVLVDLSGFFPDRRLGVFARRAAPVQVAYPNCPTTSGVPDIEYIFTDRWTCPDGMEWQYTEQPVFLPSGYLAYSPPSRAPEAAPSPVAKNGFATFGIFQRISKMNKGVWDAIGEILRACADSRLMIQNYDHTLEKEEDSVTRNALIREFRDRGVDAERLSFVGARNQLEVMAIMSTTDIALDTFPYQGQTTTCECLFMGVPVVALTGEHHVARVGSGLLRRAGLSELVADTADDYRRIATTLAASPSRLIEYRSELRGRMMKSPICDGARLAREMECAYEEMWHHWHIGRKPLDWTHYQSRRMA